ncbi:MAG: ATP-binding protein [Alphaproteobacteria bacterium]|nr:ATP-binding protein [Alphaproteobacteria bacterium]
MDDGSEWGWQAKYFDTVGDPQWAQIDKSVTAAIAKHPRLTKYFICLPLDLPDARIQGQMSAKERWDARVEKWSNQAAGAGREIEFICWGSHELLQILSKPSNVGRIRFWFDATRFDEAWFDARRDEALTTAGPRYTPEVHVDLPIATEFDAIGRTPQFFDRLRTLARGIRQKKRWVPFSELRSLNDAVASSAKTADSTVEEVLERIASIEDQPTGDLHLNAILEVGRAAEEAVDSLGSIFDEFQRNQTKVEDTKKRTATGHDPLRDAWYGISRLSSELRSANEALDHATKTIAAPIVALRGRAGTGKTHLLCDVAKRRLSRGLPTILLMGQRFISADAPWTQAMQQLDLPGISADEFVGALEAAAQAVNSRAILIVDAINEGNGRNVWPAHLGAFLTQLERSDWISTVLSIRSSYEDVIIPEEIRSRIVSITHQGFADHEYDATKIFFAHYGLELPSTPLLAPEFRNPLFLKALCSGLSAVGERRLPRGMHGTTAILDIFLRAVNKKLAVDLGYDPKSELVQKALQRIAEEFAQTRKRWLTLDHAKSLVDTLLAGREYERSLYRGLIVEGILAEDRYRHEGRARDMVFVSYERFADYAVAKVLLDAHLDLKEPAASFAKGGPLAFLQDKSSDTAPGLIEALCVYVPERTGLEFADLAPNVPDRWVLKEGFRQSLVWRSYKAFSDATTAAMSRLEEDEDDQRATLEVLVTVATLPEHPLNANFLDLTLRKSAMPERDAWWSICIFKAWDTNSAVDRLVDWAININSETTIAAEVVILAATALSWFLTTSHRFLRDRATKAVVNLLTGRLDAARAIVERFASVDDPYVLERVYAAAYGVSLRSRDKQAVGALATSVFNHVFRAGRPPAHILLRDYARGVIERAVVLGNTVTTDLAAIRPPYQSTWPKIPSEDEIKSLTPDWSTLKKGSPEWARHSISNSVLNDDFASYVIGTNSSRTHWLSVELSEPPWRPEPSPQQQLDSFGTQVTAAELPAWRAFEEADRELQAIPSELITDWEDAIDGSDDTQSKRKKLSFWFEKRSPRLKEIEGRRTTALANYYAVATEEHQKRLAALLSARETYHKPLPPRFDLKVVQRYILWRVFDLGWTVERFGYFDRHYADRYSHGRAAKKPERIGKKYQWIAYHEISALIADHFQYREEFGNDVDGDHQYEGPWQDSFRDIDPSCTLRSLPGGTSWEGHSSSWWGPLDFTDWGDPADPAEWALKHSNLPRVDQLLLVTNPTDNTRWLNCAGYFSWHQKAPADRETSDVERRQLWYLSYGYLLRAQDTAAFLDWAMATDFWGRWMPEPPEVYRMFLGEYPWAPAATHFRRPYYGDHGWTQPNNDCPVKLRTLAFEYAKESNSFDCSVDDSYTLRLPASEIISSLQLQWTGNGADFVDATGTLVSTDPTAHSVGPNALLFREDEILKFLDQQSLGICWTVIGEKMVVPRGLSGGPYIPRLRTIGAYSYSNGVLAGFIKYLRDEPRTPNHNNVLHISRL